MVAESFAVVALDWVVGKVCDEGGSRITEGAIRRILQRRAEVARQVALEEIKAGRGSIMLSAPEADEVIAILWRYLRAAEEGAARLNLRLMASTFARQNHIPLYADEFLRWSELIASLSQEEVVLLAVLHRECRGENPNLAYTSTRRQLVPSVFRDEEEFEVTAHALVRTGLVVQTALLAGGEGAGIGGEFKTSARMSRLAELADLDGVLRREGM